VDKFGEIVARLARMVDRFTTMLDETLRRGMQALFRDLGIATTTSAA
jgi:hypothetical protein